jgi:Concanavalin A-like lectin/glucanases superfamily
LVIGSSTINTQLTIRGIKILSILYPKLGQQKVFSFPDFYIPGGRGYSAYFNGVDMSQINHTKAYETREFTVSFWIFLLNGNMDGWRTIITKGEDSQQLTPTIQLWPKDTRLHVRASTDELWNDGLDSLSTLQMRKWTHIAVSYSNELLQLYINGLLDQQVILKGHIKVIQKNC